MAAIHFKRRTFINICKAKILALTRVLLLLLLVISSESVATQRDVSNFSPYIMQKWLVVIRAFVYFFLHMHQIIKKIIIIIVITIIIFRKQHFAG